MFNSNALLVEEEMKDDDQIMSASADNYSDAEDPINQKTRIIL